MSRSYLAALVLVSWWIPTLPAQEKTPIDAFVDDTTFLVARANVEKFDLKKYFQLMEALAPNPKEAAAIRTQVQAFQEKFLKTGAKEIYLVFDYSQQRPSRDMAFLVPLPPNADVAALEQLAGLIPGSVTRKIGDVLVLSEKSVVERFADIKPVLRPEFAQGLATVADQHLQAVLAPPVAFRQMVEQQVPNLPKELGGGAITTLTRLPWAALGYNSAALSQKLVVQAKDPAGAKDLAQLAELGLNLLEKMPEAKDYFPDFAKVRALLDMKVTQDRFTLVVNDKVVNEALRQGVAKVRMAAGRSQSINNLKQIALAFHLQHDVGKSFPAQANFDANGAPLLSWRVHILPYIEQEALYRQFKLNEPWNSDHNKKLIAQMPNIYRSPLSKLQDGGKTTYLVPAGKGTMFEGQMGLRVQDITDGSSNTIMVLEVDDAKAVLWTQPEDFPVNAKDPLAGLTHAQLKGFHAAFADGSVRFLSAALRPQTLLGLFSPKGGEVVDPND